MTASTTDEREMHRDWEQLCEKQLLAVDELMNEVEDRIGSIAGEDLRKTVERLQNRSSSSSSNNDEQKVWMHPLEEVDKELAVAETEFGHALQEHLVNTAKMVASPLPQQS